MERNWIFLVAAPLAAAALAQTSGVQPEAPPPVGSQGLSEPELELRITESIQQKIQQNPVLSNRSIEVSVIDDVVELNGSVENAFEQWLAQNIAASVAGKRSIRNVLQIPLEAQSSEPLDRMVAESIRELLGKNQVLGPDEEINVTVNNGVATLSGQVESTTQKMAATRDALLAGADVVDNQLAVITPPAWNVISPIARPSIWTLLRRSVDSTDSRSASPHPLFQNNSERC